MGNSNIKPHPRQRNKKQVHWKAAARPYAPGKPVLVSDGDPTPDLVTIRWIKPINDGGSPISGYLVEHRRLGSPHWVRATPLLVQLTELTISGLEPGWRYQFRVSAENAVGISDPSDLSEPITVTLQRSAVTSPRITQELKDTVSLENEKAEFVVHFIGQPSPKVCWYKDAFEIFSSRRIRILTEPDRSVLTIHQCSLSDEGEIKCTATNRAGHVSTKAKLTVNAPPSIRLPRQYEDGLLFEIGELIRLKVLVAGRPTPLIFWNHNGETIKNDDRYETEYADNSSILKINNAQRDDRGEYTIKGVNKLGEDVQSFLVTVTDKPSPPGRARVVMALGRTVTLSWSTPFDDGGCKIGNYIVEYYRLGWDVWLKAATSRQLTTILGDLIEGSEYKFRIKAESPYGISEPSEESEVIFIPDAKRGLLQPSPRSKSQPRDVNEVVVTPLARRKNKERSSSSPRVEDKVNHTETNNIPLRPVRTKVKSPSKTPEASPLPPRKDLENPSNKRALETKLNKEIFERSDRSSMARDLAYGSPDIQIKRDLQNLSIYSDKSRTPSPNSTQKMNDHKVITVKIEPPPVTHTKTPPASPEMRNLRLSRGNSENLTGSSEFMLVLYSDEDKKGQSDFDFGENLIPPPMSLSAPELGFGSPIFNLLKTSASSTELLHERAMNRLYEAVKAEEKELERRVKSAEIQITNAEIPKIQINSKDQQQQLELDRINSLKRRLSGGTTQQLRIRRRGFKNPDDIELPIQKSTLSQNQKQALMMNRERSESEEKEEIIFEGVRSKMALEKQTSTEKRKIDIVDIDKWADDYVSSTEESSFEDDYEENIERNNRKLSFYNSDEEEETIYHPSGLRMMKSSEPFEILTKRKEPPGPDFVPKPILKKVDHEEGTLSPPLSPKIKRSLSPIPPNVFKKEISLAEASLNLPLLQRTIPENEEISYSRPRSSSLTYSDDTFMKSLDEQKPIKPRKRAFSLLPQAELFQKSLVEDKPISTRQRSFSLIPPADEQAAQVAPESIYNFEQPKMSFLMQTISAAATVSGITAASIVIPDRLMEKQKDAEEAKVVIDHYGDIVKSYGNKKINSNPHVHKSRESLQRQSRESLPRVEESNEELQTSDTKEISRYRDPYTMNKNSASNQNKNVSSPSLEITENPLSLAQDTQSYFKKSTSTSEQSQINSSIIPSSIHNRSGTVSQSSDTQDMQSSYKKSSNFSQEQSQTYPSSSREDIVQSSVYNRGRTISQSSDTQDMQSFHKKSSNSSQEPRQMYPEFNRSRTVSQSSDTGKNSRVEEMQSPYKKSSSPSPEHNQMFSSRSAINRSRTVSQSSDTDKNSRTRAFSPSSDNNSGKSIPRKTRTFTPPLNSDTRENTSPKWGHQGRTISSSPMRKSGSRKTASPYPTNRENRKTEPSPMRLRPPKLKEIMTQTSVGLGSFDFESSIRTQKEEKLIAKAEVTVHRFVDYLTDLVMFMVACWLYLFKNELFAIPVLLVLVYRQLQAEISKRIPNWLVKLVRRIKRNKLDNS